MLKRTRRALSFWIAMIVTFTWTSGCNQDRPPRVVPDFTLPQVRGGVFHWHAGDSQAVLLAFLQTVPDTADTPSHQQVGFLRSLHHQYGTGLTIVMIDSSALLTHHPPATNALVNASYDWQLDFPLLEDDANRLARNLGINQLPTLILLRSDGSVAQRWSGLTGPAPLMQSVAKLFYE